MASKALFRRLLHVNRRAFLYRPTVIRPVSAVHHIQLGHDLQVQSMAPSRSFCCKPGDGMIFNVQNREDFEERVLNSDLPVVVDFHASWCGPCKLLGPRLEALIGSKEGKVLLAKIDVDEEDELAMEYGIQSVPTVIAFKNKQSVNKFIGLKDDNDIEEFLDRLIEL